jgi:hypothetical protein
MAQEMVIEDDGFLELKFPAAEGKVATVVLDAALVSEEFSAASASCNKDNVAYSTAMRTVLESHGVPAGMSTKVIHQIASRISVIIGEQEKKDGATPQ